MEIKKDKLTDELRDLARTIGMNRYFWEVFTDKLMDGAVPSLDLKKHYKNKKSDKELSETIHSFLFPGQPFGETTQELKELYVKLVQQLLVDLDY